MSDVYMQHLKFFAVLIVAAFSVLVRLLPNIPNWIVYHIQTTWLLLALLSMLILYCHGGNYEQKHSGRRGREPQDITGIDDFLEKYTPTICIYVFGGGSLCLRLFYVTASVQCFHYYFTRNVTFNASEPRSSLTEASLATDVPFALIGEPKDTVRQEELARLLCDSVSIIFLVAHLPFLKKLSTFHGLKKSFWCHHCILVIIAADGALWLYTFLQEIGLMTPYYGKDGHKIEVLSLSKACLEHASPLHVYMHGTLEHALFPLTLEFMLTAMEILIEAWYFQVTPADQVLVIQSGAESQGRDTPSGQSSIEVQRPISVPDQPAATKRTGSRRRSYPEELRPLVEQEVASATDSAMPSSGTPSYRDQCCKLWGYFVSIFDLNAAFVLLLIEGVVVRTYLLYDKQLDLSENYFQPYTYDLYVKLLTTVVRIVTICVPGLVVALHCLGVLSTFRERPDCPGLRMQGNDFVLIVAGLGSLGVSLSEICFCASSLAKEMKDNDWIYLFSILESFLYIPQLICTAAVIRLGETKMYNPDNRLADTLQGALNFLAMYSFGLWLTDSFIETEYLIDQDTNSLWTDEKDFPVAWRYCVQFFLPLCIYVRFLSVLRLLRVKRLLRNSEPLQEATRRETSSPAFAAVTPSDVVGASTWTAAATRSNAGQDSIPIPRKPNRVPGYGSLDGAETRAASC